MPERRPPAARLVALGATWLVLACLALGMAAPAAAGAASKLPEPVRAALRAAKIPESAMGIVVMTPEGRIVLARNADRAMTPASVMKLVTTFAALETLGPAYTWRTEVYANGPVTDGRLAGDLVLKGGGDPRLTLEKLWLLLRDVRARGVRDIAGDLVVDRSAFDVADVNTAAFDGQGTRPYNVGPEALLVNFRTVRLTFLPDPDDGAVRILSEPPLPEFGIENRLTLAEGDCTSWPENPVADFTRYSLRFEGAYPAACGEQVKYFTLLPPLDYTGALFGHLWRELGGTFSGQVREGTPGADARLITSIESPPLAEVVRDINKNSNNVMARQLFLTLGMSPSGPATLPAARDAVRNALLRAGIAAPELVVDNGSGLSRDARLSPATLARLLRAAWLAPFGAELIASMPVAGVDGTLKRWFANSVMARHAHLKTGYLDGVRSLAGYVHGIGGQTLIAVSIINHPNAINGVAAQEALMQWVHARATDGTCCTGTQRAARGARSFSGSPAD